MYSVLVCCYSRKGEKYSKGELRHTGKGNEKKEIDGWEKTEILVGPRQKMKEEERNLEERVIHFYGSRTHYLLIRAHTFFCVI